ncbi:HvfC/BufC N-terminal domain-containing protein [Oceanicola sp. S124]|uniref:HvfC/BufC N-terminal domain-containing protein n=1 Tax=Oceanicola sp. S124 TaxID=1042378 RepID=UPI0002557E06|nr:DNA-binding domain-containing protein [Oceanicola sp. S124]
MSPPTQADFRTAMLRPEAPVPEGLGNGHGGPAGRRFAVYRNNVAVGLTEAVVEGFPTLRALLGEDNLRALAAPFLRAHPPSSPLMFRYGAALPGFLRSFQPLAHMGYLPDVARLDLARRESYHAADATPLDPARLAAIPPADLARARLGLAPSLRVVRSAWPLWQIWQLAHHDGPPPRPVAEDILITRPGFDPTAHHLPAGGAGFLDALGQGRSAEAASEAALAEAPDADLPALLGLLLKSGALTSLEIPT